MNSKNNTIENNGVTVMHAIFRNKQIIYNSKMK